MHNPAQRIADAWLVASADLGIQVTIPFALPRETGEQVPYLLLIHSFGSKLGTVITTTSDDFEDGFEVAELHGYYASGLNPLHYSKYDRDTFVGALTDWGWFGASPPPSWYHK